MEKRYAETKVTLIREVINDGEEVRRTLAVSCAKHEDAEIALLMKGHAFPCRLIGIRGGAIHLAAGSNALHHVRHDSLVFVSWIAGGTLYGFIGHVRNSSARSAPSKREPGKIQFFLDVTLDVPTLILTHRATQSCRFPLIDPNAVSVTVIEGDHAPQPAELVDISYGGFRLKMKTSPDCLVAGRAGAGAECGVVFRVSAKDKALEIKAEPRSAHGDEVSFSVSPETQSTAAYREIVGTVERLYLLMRSRA